MENTAKSLATDGREDISQFIVHLTRNDQKTFPDGGNTAKKNFQAILESRTILATRPHCLFNQQLDDLSDQEKEKFNVACFTEVPLNQLHLLIKEIPGRQIKLESYGFVFTKDFIIKSGGQPAIYINSYNNNLWLRDAVKELFKVAQKNGEFVGNLWRLLPFINSMDEKHDFSWEREWRINKDLEFELNDLVCLILPVQGEYLLKRNLTKEGITFISPGWTYEQIVTQLARQQKATKKFLLNKIKQLQTKSEK
ncbi:Protein of unknown function (DUF2743) [Cylindrospermum stagnale PCC 7417]|uniref:Uncharacterized protein n=1 Tax=Cylindrospermum stagnale PCC 7417 TaxID=56107 RepID=K9X5G9_9NOST|nr:DUF2743 domain-containing protein [Cylindrospermum stagnale]AFZ27905.1 Protein of unknown function (DUF2743) [Cylindrospermum stagnale PCC 7417]